MTTTAETPAFTVGDLFSLGAEGDTPDEASALFGAELRDAKVDAGALLGSIRGQISGVLDIPVAEVMASAWAKARQLQEYRDPERHPPGETSLLALAEHTITSSYAPSVELVLQGKLVQRLTVEVRVELTVEALHLEIRDARIVAVVPGRCQAGGRVSCQQWVLAQRETRTLQLPGRASLGDGIEIPGPTADDD